MRSPCHATWCGNSPHRAINPRSGVLKASIGFRALHLTQPNQILREPVSTVQHAWAVHGHGPRHSPPRYVRGRHDTMGTTLTTPSKMRAQHTERATQTASCRTKSRKCERCSR